ncbi:hypothetical protein A3K86_20245 [Photobacterium jeanii]|uniref:diguanylate cyclase n=1 Tax=Photobacterium jeanii TaxID=858640 RepID=A0A178K1S9_9GAMM|nr:tetratricopeptide repeat-containing diguanylate cyclase [Photobacterium jeanii]OAN11289.1 hypothetical protein A3K86_20245 [Photobacterium jeanii]PST90809.1 GGDEF domain-containing protein [Photobacterium jeanii]
MYQYWSSSLVNAIRISFISLIIAVGCVIPAQAKPSDFVYTPAITEQDSRIVAAYIQSLRDPKYAYSLVKQFVAGKSGKPMTDWERVYYVLTMSRLDAYTITKEEPLDTVSELEVLARKLGVPWIKAEALLHRAIVAKETAHYGEGLAYLDEVLVIADQTGFKNLRARALKWQANILYYQSRYELVLANYLEALTIFEAQQDYAQVVLVLSNIGNMYLDMDQWELAQAYNKKAFEALERYHVKSDYTAALLYIHAGLVDHYYKRQESEASNIRKAIFHANQTGSSYIQLVTLTNYTSILLDENKLQASLKMSKECLEIADNIQDKLGRAFCYESKSMAYLELNSLKKSVTAALIALNVYKEYGSHSQVIRLYKILSDIYKKGGNYKTSLEYFQRYIDEKESNFLRQKRKEIRLLQTQYNTQQKEQQIALLKAESELKSSQIQSQRSREIILALSVLLAASILSLLYRRNNHLSKNNEALTEQSFQDPLTGMYNRRYIERWLEGKLLKEKPQSGSYVLAILDIDHFKAINDTYGHDIGDRVLQEVASRLQQSCREHDKVVRWGGEEFIAIFAVTESTDCLELLDRIRHAVRFENIEMAGEALSATVSIGGVEVPSSQTLQSDWQHWLVKADSALYCAKDQGRDCVVVSSENDD